MTDEVADENVPDEPTFRVRRPGGDWEDLPKSEPLSDKPEINDIGKLSMGEVRRILRDEDDPRHEEAVEYDRLQRKRMGPMLASVFKEIATPSPLAGYVDALGLSYRKRVAEALPTFPAASLIDLPKFDTAQYFRKPVDPQPAIAHPPVRTRPQQPAAEPVAVPQVEDVAGPLRELVKITEENAAASRADRAADRAAAEKVRAADAKTQRRNARREWIGIVSAAALGLAALVLSLVK